MPYSQPSEIVEIYLNKIQGDTENVKYSDNQTGELTGIKIEKDFNALNFITNCQKTSKM